MLRTTRCASIILRAMEEAGRCYLENRRIVAAAINKELTTSGQMEITSMRSIWRQTGSTLRYILSDRITCMLKLENHQDSMELFNETEMENKRDIRFF